MRQIARFVLASLFIAALGGCETPPEPVRVGMLVWPPYELAFVARERGYFDDSEIELIVMQTPAELVRSYRYGIIDAMYVTSQFALTNASNMADSRIIHIIDFSFGGDALLARPEIEEPADLEGRRIGMEAGPLGAYTLIRALDDTGLDRSDVEIVFVDTPNQMDAYRSGKIDAVATYEPTRSHLKEIGARELFNSRAIPLEIIDVLLARDTVIENNTDMLTAFVNGVDQALEDYRLRPRENIELMARRHGLSEQGFKQAMDGVRLLNLEDNRALLSGTDSRLLRGLERQSEVMQKAGMLKEQPSLEALLETRIVDGAER